MTVVILMMLAIIAFGGMQLVVWLLFRSEERLIKASRRRRLR